MQEFFFFLQKQLVLPKITQNVIFYGYFLTLFFGLNSVEINLWTFRASKVWVEVQPCQIWQQSPIYQKCHLVFSMMIRWFFSVSVAIMNLTALSPCDALELKSTFLFPLIHLTEYFPTSLKPQKKYRNWPYPA